MKKKRNSNEIRTNNFVLVFPKECSRKTALKINKLLFEMEPNLVQSKTTAKIQTTNIRNAYHIWNEPYHYDYYRGKLVKNEVQQCSMCGKILDMFDVQENFVFDKYIGYGSSFDTTHLKFRLCIDCMDSLLAKNIIPTLKSVEICEDYLLDTHQPISLNDLKKKARDIMNKDN